MGLVNARRLVLLRRWFALPSLAPLGVLVVVAFLTLYPIGLLLYGSFRDALIVLLPLTVVVVVRRGSPGEAEEADDVIRRSGYYYAYQSE